MKKQITYLFIISLLSISCAKEYYSCTPSVNEWVKQHKAMYANIPRSQLASFDRDKQSGLFVSFTPQQKARIYQEKYDYLMGLEILSQKEKEQLTKLFQLVTPEIYQNEANRTKFNILANEWEKETKELLGWSDSEIFLHTHTWLTLEEIEDVITRNMSYMGEVAFGRKPNCTCLYDTYCWFLSLGTETCAYGNCEEVLECGIVGNSNCKGLCK